MPFTPPFFNKIGSSTKDLLSKKYDYDNEIKFCTKAPGGWTLEATGSDAGKGGLGGLTTLKYGDSSFGEAEGTVHTSGDPKKTKVQVKFDKFQKGFDATICADGSLGGDVTVNYKQDMAAASAKLVSRGDNVSFDASACLGMDGAVFGISALSADLSSLTDYNAGLQYSASNFTASLTTKKKCSAVGISLFQQYSKSLQWGSAMDLSSNQMAVGVQYNLDKATTLKAKASTAGTFATAIEHQVTEIPFKMTLAAEFDASSEQVVAKNFGVGLVFG